MTLSMLKGGNLFRIALLAPALAACVGSEDGIRTVGPEDYVSRSCWFNAGEEFTGFLVLARNNENQVAYPVSSKCVVQLDQRSLGASTLRQLGAVELVDRDGTLQRALPGPTMSTSVATHQLMPSLNSRVYYFRARVRIIPMSGNPVYSPVEILQLEAANITFERFLELDLAGRERLWRARPH